MTISEPRVAKPEVSVLVPTYNTEKYLAQALDSLVAQTFTDFEVLVINDGSTDGSVEIARSYMERDSRFRLIDKSNSGYGASMNIGLDAALGSYVAILEPDDFFEPCALELLHDAAVANDSDVVKADFWLYWSTPEQRRRQFRIVDDREIGRTMRPLDDLAIFFRKPSIWSALYSRAFLRRNGIRFLETPGASYQDAGFNFKVWASADRATFIGEPILSYRQDNEASSVNSAGKSLCVCDEYEAMERFIDERCSGNSALRGICERMKFDSYMWNYDRLSKDLRLDFLKHASQEFRKDDELGMIDFELFEPWAEADLRALMSDPEGFDGYRSKFTAPGKLNSFKHYLRLGGIPLVMKVLAFKTFKHSVRRLNSEGGAA